MNINKPKVDGISIQSSTDLQEYRESIQQNLPKMSEPFIGRADYLRTLIKHTLRNSIRVTNINGPPAFGKSRLAIRLGEMLLEKHTDIIKIVRYVDTETASQSEYICSKSKMEGSPSMKSLTNVKEPQESTTSSNDMSLCQWIRELKQRSILILDNCDHILHNDYEHFTNIINDHLNEHNTTLTIVIVSQEKLFFTSTSFFALHIKELSAEDSRAMLKYYVPIINDEQADQLSIAVGQCPLALKVVGRLLQERGIDNFGSLLKDLNDQPVRILSNKVTIEEEKFRTVMDIAYKHLDKRTQTCSRLFSQFPGPTSYKMEETVLGSVVDIECVDDVIRKSLIEEIYIGDETRHSMHKLIRKYLDEMVEYKYWEGFRRKFIDFYSNYLMQLLKRQYGQSEKLNDKEDFTIKYLERLNIDHFQTVLSEIKNDPLEVDKVLAVSYLIQEDLLNSDPFVAGRILFAAHNSYKELSMFKTVCTYSSDVICARILWKVFVDIGASKCANIVRTKDFCDSLLDCKNLTALKHQNTFDLIQKAVITDYNYTSDNLQMLFFEKLTENFHECELSSWRLIQLAKFIPWLIMGGSTLLAGAILGTALILFGVVSLVKCCRNPPSVRSATASIVNLGKKRGCCTHWKKILECVGGIIIFIFIFIYLEPISNITRAIYLSIIKILYYFFSVLDGYVSESVDTDLAY